MPVKLSRRYIPPVGGDTALKESLVRRDQELSTAILDLSDTVDGLGAPGGVSDGDKGDITVSSSGAVWSLDAATVGITELSASGAASASTFLRGDNQWATPTAVVSDGDKGDITVSGGGTSWSIDAGVVGVTKMSASGSAGVNSYLRGDNQWVDKYTLVAQLAADASTVATVVPITLTGLVWSYEANSTYFFDWRGQCMTGASTTGIGFQIDVSSAITSIAMQFFHQLANTGTLSGGTSQADDTSLGVSSGNATNATNFPVSGTGVLRTGANTGTAQLRFRAEVAATATAKAGLTLVVQKVV